MKMFRTKSVTVEPMAGSGIKLSISEAIELAEELDALVDFEFSGVSVTVEAGSDAGLIHRDWSRALHGFIDKNVGPHPAPTLTAEEIESDERMEVEAMKEAEKKASEWKRDADEKTRKLAERLESSPAMMFSDKDKWDDRMELEKDSSYGLAALDFAEKWARLMQSEIIYGGSIEKDARRLSFEADDNGITGFMYGCAVSVLSETWIHGEELKQWHQSERG